MGFYTLQNVNIILIRKHIFDPAVVSEVTCMPVIPFQNGSVLKGKYQLLKDNKHTYTNQSNYRRPWPKIPYECRSDNARWSRNTTDGWWSWTTTEYDGRTTKRTDDGWVFQNTELWYTFRDCFLNPFNF